MESFILEIVAGLITAAIAGGLGYAFRGKRYKAAIKDAPSNYAERLGQLIEKAYQEGVKEAVVNAQAIVSIRNEMRASLITISQNLNSEISMMQAILYDDFRSYEEESILKKFLATKGKSLSDVDPAKLFHQIEVLHKTWPEKRIIIETQVRKLMTELGLESA